MAGVASILLLLSGCTVVGRQYERPEVATPSAFTGGGSWKQAEPADHEPREDWWTAFGDPILDSLQVEALLANQDLRVAVVRIDGARSAITGARAALLPAVSLLGRSDRTRYSPNAGVPLPVGSVDNTHLVVGAAWELDLFGKIRRGLEAADHGAAAQVAAFETVRLALHAEVARTWFALRATDTELAALTRTLDTRRAATELARARVETGAAPDFDLSRAETEQATIEAELHGTRRLAAELRTALAVLLGKPAPSFSLPTVATALPAVPTIPVGLPSSLLERRPDVAAAERELAAANARIGVAEGAFFPSIQLTGEAGGESTQLHNLLGWSSRIWSFGPRVSLPLFQGSMLRADLQRAEAAYEEGVARFRQQVLVAFREVQDALTATDLLAQKATAERQALAAAVRAAATARLRYEGGFVAYLEVVDAERTLAEVERAVARSAGERLINAVQLFQALGGGYRAVVITGFHGS